MKQRKKIDKVAKAMFKNSLTNGFIDSKKAKLALSQITTQKPPNLVKILKIYKNLIENAQKKEEIVIESASLITNLKLEKALLAKTGAKRTKFKINPNIVIGAKITHGDWIWDESLKAKLEQLTMNN